jgi:predicted RNA-binding Zn-ribbon protein involved in translation (DUF1610 family)
MEKIKEKIKNEKVEESDKIPATCPKCKKQLTSLNNVQSGYTIYNMYADDDNQIIYNTEEFETDNNTNEWDCPYCGEKITESEEIAEKILLKNKEN